MSDVTGPTPAPADPKAETTKGDAAPGAVATVDDWKPEPRQWTWKDLFTAPMLAFKPKCMVISALTLIAITAWMWLSDEYIVTAKHGAIVQSILQWLQLTVAIVLFSLGGSFVAVFLKADLLDDEFLSFGEALGQYKSRILPAVLVPIFLMVLMAGVYIALMYLPVLASSIPYVGPLAYALLHPLMFLFSLFIIVLTIAVWLSIFVFPSIIAIRKHGWFDNVVDTIEAVGTKPHVLFGSLLLSGLMMTVALYIGMGAIEQLKTQHRNLPESFRTAVRDTETRASDFYAADMIETFQRYVLRHSPDLPIISLGANPHRSIGFTSPSDDGFHKNVTGPITGIWQILIQAFILGYVLNLFISGGMLTYLVVREDDYWDDEDLEDLDKLAKELEEEAKRDQGVTAETKLTEAKAAEIKAADAKPVESKPSESTAATSEPKPAADETAKPASEPAAPSDPPKTDEPPKA